MDDLKKQLDIIENKIDKIIKHQEWEKDQWSESKSFGRFAKQWGGFYIASLLADETLGLNGNNLFRNNGNAK